MYLLNNLKFNIGIQHVIGDVQYPAGWFTDSDNRAAVGVVEVADPVWPDTSLFAVVENPNGSLASTPLSAEAIAANTASRDSMRISMLWNAADRYQNDQISATAVSMLVMPGVMQALPKCTAVSNWIKAIWSQYYERKFGGSSDFDFSNIGPIPHSVPELSAEVTP